MMEMIKKNWGKIVLTSAVVLAASLAGGYGWVMPVVMLAAHLLCLLSAFGDKRIHTQSRKALDILFWIMPVGSVLLAVISRISESGADDDLLTGGETAQQGFVAHTVLQGHQDGVGIDEGLVFGQRGLGGAGLDLHDDQVDRGEAGGVGSSMGVVDALAAVRLADSNAIFGNGLHFGGVGAHQGNIMVLGQVAAEQQSHRAEVTPKS